jgi:glycine hydroxymethyltransferase
MLVDLTRLGITGKAAEAALGLAGITANKNTIPFETRSPFVTSGIRLGTPALTTRGMKAPEMKMIAGFIADILKAPNAESLIEKTRKKVHELCEAFPIYAEST